MSVKQIPPDLTKPADLLKGLLKQSLSYAVRNSQAESIGTFYLNRYSCSAHFTLYLTSTTTSTATWVSFNREFDLRGLDSTGNYRVYQDIEDLALWCFPFHNDLKYEEYQSIYRSDPKTGKLVEFGTAIWLLTGIPL